LNNQDKKSFSSSSYLQAQVLPVYSIAGLFFKKKNFCEVKEADNFVNSLMEDGMRIECRDKVNMHMVSFLFFLRKKCTLGDVVSRRLPFQKR